MPPPDVRVRLSAEGVAEVVGALKKVQTESDRTAAKQSRGFGRLNSVLGSTTNLLAGLGIAVGFVQLKGLISNAIEAADQINKLGAKVGASSRNLSALQLVARTADSDLNQLGSALVRMNKNIGDAQAGIPTMVAAFRDLGLEMADFKGKDSVEVFELISKRIMALPDSIRQGRSAIQIFGRAGAMLLPTMRALADEGLGSVIERAEELGVLIDTDLAAAAEKIKDDVEILKMQSEGLGTRFVSGFGPQMSQALQALSGDLSQTTEAWRDFGTGIGVVMKFVIGVVSGAFDLIGTLAANGVFAIQRYATALWLVARGRLDEAKEYFENTNEALMQSQSELYERMRGRFQLVFTMPEPPAGTTGAGAPTGEPAEDPAELAARRAQAMQMILERELALTRLQGTLRNNEERRAFEQGLKDIHAYYDERRRIAEDAFAKTEEVLQKKREALASEVDPARRLQEEGKIEDQLARARLEREEAIAAATYEEAETVRKLNLERLDFEKKLLEAQGRRTEAALLGIDEEIRKTDILLRKQGVGDQERQEALDRLRASLEAGINFDEAKRQADDALASLDAARAEIDAKVAAGLLSQFEGEQRLLMIEEDRLDLLQGLAEGLEEAALATGDPEKIAQAQAFAEAIRDIGFSVEASKVSFQNFKAAAIDAGIDALANFFDTGITGAKSFRDAFREMGAGVINTLRRMAAELLAVAIMKKIAGIFGFGFSGGGEVGAEAKATGGLLGGRGTGRSDSNLAWFSRGEYLVRAAVVEQPGVLAHLDDLNRRGTRAIVSPPALAQIKPGGFAEGGLIGAGGPEAVAGGDSRLFVGLEEGLVLRALETSAGQRILVKSIGNNRRAVRSALGT